MKRGAAAFGAAVAVVLVPACSPLTASGASAPSTPAPGWVSGFAELCSGLPYSLPGAHRPSGPPMKVHAQQGGRTIATQTLSSTGGRYHLSLAPGTYTISVPGSGDPPETITLSPRSTVTLNFPNRCK